MREELEVLGRAMGQLQLSPRADDVVLADHPGRRHVVRAGDVVIKAFSTREAAAWQRELAGLRAVGAAAPGLAPPLVGAGEGWTATAWFGGQPALVTGTDPVRVHQQLGRWLLQLHHVPPSEVRQLPVADRLRGYLRSPPAACPSRLARAVAALVEPWFAFVTAGSLVHGDWGTSNVLLVDGEIVAIIDFEDAHEGDPAEDFKWQVLSGVASDEYEAMASAYAAAGGTLGAHARERLALAGAELCLDVLGWELAEPQRSRFHARCVATLEELVGGLLPAWNAA